jgi:branched-chain amino acid transport system permease protein
MPGLTPVPAEHAALRCKRQGMISGFAGRSPGRTDADKQRATFRHCRKAQSHVAERRRAVAGVRNPVKNPNGGRASARSGAAARAGTTRGSLEKEAGRRMEVFVQQLINGITLGSIYGLIAIGYTMVFGIIGMVNFAHGDVFMVSSFIALIMLLILTTWLGLTSVALALFIVLIVAMVFTSLVNWVIERTAYRPLRGSFRLAPLISAIGMSIFLSNFVQVTQGPRNKATEPLLRDVIVLMHGNGYDVTLSYRQIIIWFITAVLLAAFWYLVSKTSLGRAQRACEQDQKMAALVGVDVDRTISITFIIGAALAAVAGTMYLMYYGVVNFSDGFVPGIKAFTAAVLGGIGSLPGAVIGGLLIGLIETMWSAYFSIDYKDVAAFSILAITLIFLPQGLLGRPEVEKV